MKITLKQIPIRDLVKGYSNNDEENGAWAFNGKVNVRPSYQREIIYDDIERNDVIKAIYEFPNIYILGNPIYWLDNHNGTFSLFDGLQRTSSICHYVTAIPGPFTVDFGYGPKNYHNLLPNEQEQILNYVIPVHIITEATQDELEILYKRLNVRGKKQSPQEILNFSYNGPWLSDAKRYFSKTNCVAWDIGKDYVVGSPIRQEFLEAALAWISSNDIPQYMADHQFDKNAEALWLYFQNVINWIKKVFTNPRREMKGLPWGKWYNLYKDNKYNADEFEKEISKLIEYAEEDEITNLKGIYEYLLTGDEKYLNRREFSNIQKSQMFERQKGICPHCKKKFKIEGMHADHIKPWWKGGKTVIDNGQMLCAEGNLIKSDNYSEPIELIEMVNEVTK